MWCASARGFTLSAFVDHCRSTKPPYTCPYERCGGRRRYRSLAGLLTHLTEEHDAADQLPDDVKRGVAPTEPAPEPQQTPIKKVDPVANVAAPLRLVDILVNGETFKLNVNEPLELQSVTDADCPADATTAAVQERFTQIIAQRESKSDDDCDNDGCKPVPVPVFRELPSYRPESVALRLSRIHGTPCKMPPTASAAYVRHVELSPDARDAVVEYDMDEEDTAWLSTMNARRSSRGLNEVSVTSFELLMDRFEKEARWADGRVGQHQTLVDEDARCCVCNDHECEDTNVIMFCDLCNMAVHQECYGVPYIPEGQWLCRRCQLSPSQAVQCCLCPNDSSSAAFKQTSDGRWCHVLCAIWVPEVHFANTVFLEPVEGIQRVPVARWKLKCIVCREKGVGACIQCHKPSCYTAFHVTCAQSAGLYMRVEPAADVSPGGSAYTVRKFVYCDLHAPESHHANKTAEVSPNNKLVSTAARKQKQKERVRNARKVLADRKNVVPMISVPVMSKDQLEHIAAKVRFDEVASFMPRLLAYWTLKRRSRFGVPLIRRLQARCNRKATASGSTARKTEGSDSPAAGIATAAEAHMYLEAWHTFRRHLERLRLLCEMLKNREKKKAEIVAVSEEIFKARFMPSTGVVHDIIGSIEKKDTHKIFHLPVSEKEVPGYSNIIKKAMDLQTMRKKATAGKYSSIEELNADLKLMFDNCLLFNRDNKFFYDYGVRLRRVSNEIVKRACVLHEDGKNQSGSIKHDDFVWPDMVPIADEELDKAISANPFVTGDSFATPVKDSDHSTSTLKIENSNVPATSSASKGSTKKRNTPKSSPMKKVSFSGAAAKLQSSKRRLDDSFSAANVAGQKRRKAGQHDRGQTSLLSYFQSPKTATGSTSAATEFREPPTSPATTADASTASSDNDDAAGPSSSPPVRSVGRPRRAAARSPRLHDFAQLDLVWAPCKVEGTECRLPAVVLDPNMPREGISLGEHVHITPPCKRVLSAKPEGSGDAVVLLHYLHGRGDEGRAWRPAAQLRHMGLDGKMDERLVKMALGANGRSDTQAVFAQRDEQLDIPPVWQDRIDAYGSSLLPDSLGASPGEKSIFDRKCVVS